MNDEKATKLIEIVNNEELITKISNAETKEEMMKIFADNGLEMSISEIDAFIKMMNVQNETEIGQEELESVAGGSFTAAWIFSQSWTGIKKVARNCWNAGKWFANQGW